MESKSQTYQDYTNYIKCGEILKSPVPNHQDSIILKCFKCSEIHFVLDAFVLHIGYHFKDLLTSDQQILKAQYENEDEWESEGIGIDNASIKLEDLVKNNIYVYPNIDISVI